jgi:hypothetical protein
VIVVIAIYQLAFSQVNHGHGLMLIRATLFVGLLMFSLCSLAVSEITISVESISHAQGDVKDLEVVVDLNKATNKTPSITLNTKIKPKVDAGWIKAHLSCDLPKHVLNDTWHCDQGLFKSTQMHVPFSLALTPQASGIEAKLKLKEADFSDAVGLHAAEHLTGDLQLKLTKEGDNLRWKNTLNWTGGEMFWQPFFLKGGGHQFVSSGVLRGETLQLDDAILHIHKVGRLNLKGQMQLADRKITQLEADLPALDLATAFPVLFKPLLENSIVYNAEMAGNIAFKANIVDSELKSLDIKLTDVDIEDENQKFAFYKLNAHIPWDYDDVKQVELSYLNGHLLNVPLGNTQLEAEVIRIAWTAPNIRLPILDGALNLSDISAARIAGQWYWHLGADISPIDMAQLSQSLDLPIMQGTVAGIIPKVTYSTGILTTNGEMQFSLFDGDITVDHLVLFKPLSIAPKLNADMHLRNLDLGKLTDTFSFGTIKGKLDGEVSGLVMENWRPVAFDANVKSSPGKYRKKISQRAVENISALGGAGAANAVQRSILRFFDEFNYANIGLSCKLNNNICEMNGLTSTQGGYTIVEGSGIPAITVKGFNQTVAWNELLSRIKRITDGNTEAVVK